MTIAFNDWEHLYPAEIPDIEKERFIHGPKGGFCDFPTDLREELSDLLSCWGHWVVLRKMKIGTYSRNYDRLWREAVGGPKWEYDDIPVLTRKSTVRKTVVLEGEQIWPQGVLSQDYAIFYLENTVNPTTEDIIFYTSTPEIEPISPREPYTEKWDIKAVFDMRGESGRVEFWVALGFRDTVKES